MRRLSRTHNADGTKPGLGYLPMCSVLDSDNDREALDDLVRAAILLSLDSAAFVLGIVLPVAGGYHLG